MLATERWMDVYHIGNDAGKQQVLLMLVRTLLYDCEPTIATNNIEELCIPFSSVYCSYCFMGSW